MNFYAWKNDPTNLIALRVTYHITFELMPTFIILYVLTKKLPPKHEEYVDSNKTAGGEYQTLVNA